MNDEFEDEIRKHTGLSRDEAFRLAEQQEESIRAEEVEGPDVFCEPIVIGKDGTPTKS